MSLQSACATTNCIYDNDFFKPSRYENNMLVENLKFNKDDNTAKIITQQGELISVKHWSCNHHDVQATMLNGPYLTEKNSNINKQLIKLAGIALDKYEADIVKNFIKSKSLTLKPEQVTLYISNNEYSEFYIRLLPLLAFFSACTNTSDSITPKFYG